MPATRRRTSAAGPDSATDPNATDPCWNFTPKHRWSFKNNAISGICFGRLLELLWTFRAHIQWRLYWQRVLFLVAISLLNSCLGLVETLLFGWTVARQAVNPRPVFVLGHPRTGTTMLHNLLSLPEAGFGHATSSGDTRMGMEVI